MTWRALVFCPVLFTSISDGAQLRASAVVRTSTAVWPASPDLPINEDATGGMVSGVLTGWAKARLEGTNPAANKYVAGPGDDRDSDVNATATNFGTCSQACHQCFVDHYQGCLAYCEVGCEDYCVTKLSEAECERKASWTAKVAHVFQAFDPHARMCASTGFNGCPFNPADHRPKKPPVAPYPAAAAEDAPTAMKNNKTVLEASKGDAQGYHQELLMSTFRRFWKAASSAFDGSI